MTFDRDLLEAERARDLQRQSEDAQLAADALGFVVKSDHYNYAYQWSWCGLPILQLPQDVLATQEILHRCKPNVVIETGVAWGGGIALYASITDLYHAKRIIGIDLNLANSVQEQIQEVGFKTPIELIRGSSTDPAVVDQVKGLIDPSDSVMVILDSNHTHAHVLRELEIYAPLVTPGQYCIVSDTIVEFIPPQTHRPRPWGPGANPWTAVQAYLEHDRSLISDQTIDQKIIMTFNPGGYLKRLEASHPQ
jgi:cephalosporin hydroxylase